MNFAQLLAKVTGFESQMTALSDKVTGLETQLVAQTKKAETLETELSGVKNELQTVQTEKESLETKATEAETKVETLTQENTELKGKVENPEGTIQKEAAKQAQNIVSMTGTPPVEATNEGEETASGQSINEEYMSIEDPGKRFEFFNKNFQALNKALASQLN